LATRKQLNKRAKEISDLRLKYYADQRNLKEQYWALLQQAKLDPEKFSGYSRHDIFAIKDVELRKALIAKRIELHKLSASEWRNEVDDKHIRLQQAHRLADNWRPVIALEELSPEWSDRPLSLLVVFRGPGRRRHKYDLQHAIRLRPGMLPAPAFFGLLDSFGGEHHNKTGALAAFQLFQPASEIHLLRSFSNLAMRASRSAVSIALRLISRTAATDAPSSGVSSPAPTAVATRPSAVTTS